MILDIDVGNTRVKWRLGTGDAAIRGWYLRGDAANFAEAKPAAVRVSSVAGEIFEGELSEALQTRWGVVPWFARTPAQAHGLTNSYDDPTRMGVDRWLAMLAAWKRSGGPVCVVDAGSALTIDLVAADGVHRGGYIIPGCQTMQRSLLAGTDRVRFDGFAPVSLEPGTSTATAVGHGVLLAIVGSIELALARATASGESYTTIVCGGDGEAVAGLLSGAVDFAPDLVFDGLDLAATGK
ncbi:MAG: type III pantothenate kinase [Halieaceae bacterium]